MPKGERIGRYLIFDEIAAGGMATVHLGRLVGDVGFSRTVAIKRLHPHYAKDPDFVSMFLDEARLAARVSHPNVVQTLDVVAQDDALVLVMEYVRGDSLSSLLRAARLLGQVPAADIAAAVLKDALNGLHAAHEALDVNGVPLGLVHRDVSPHNVLVGVDGVARMLDFGIAKAVNQLHTTREGQLKGKLAYMAPEQLEGAEASRRSDVYASAILLWEALTARRCFEGDTPGAIIGQIRAGVTAPSKLVPGVSPALDAIVARGSAIDPEERFATARDMALALEKTAIASTSTVGAWVDRLAWEMLATRASRVAVLEADDATRTEGRPSRPPSSSRLAIDDGPVTGSMPSAKGAVVVPVEKGETVAPVVVTPQRDRRGLWMAVVALVIASAVAARYVGEMGATTPVAAGPGSAVALTASSVAPRPETSAGEAASAHAGADADAGANANANASASASANAKPRRPGTGTGTGTGAVAPATAKCDPPYSLGPNGRRIPKPECF